MPSSPLDRQRLGEALALAESSFGLTEPNPRVGCVIGSENGQVFGRGATQQAGGPHAEVMALREAAAAGHSLRGATAWVTLEPCAHHGRTPPCCDALVAAGLSRVVVGVGDPFPAVDGAGIARLRAAGIEVTMADADLAAACRGVNIGFFSRVRRGRAWVRLKVAASLDGRTALPDGRSQWITGPEARRDGHAWRRRASTVLTGIGTVLADDPRLDVRLVETPAQPARVVLDPRWRTPLEARLFEAGGALAIVGLAGAEYEQRRAALQARGADTVELPHGADGRAALDALLGWLAARPVNELHVEAGAALTGAWLRAGLADELLLYLAPRLVGEGRPLAELGRLGDLAQALPLHLLESAAVGTDLRLRYLTDQGLAAHG
jgi:diaminohydroxyphosphoribosylaminopyrimidine deaminase/5-amino-6-(5-phosphoribosylamino)uracil reductase